MSDLYQIVDEDDIIIDHKLRDQIDTKNDIYRSAALWLVNSQSQALIAKRALNKDKYPGKWGPAAAGTLEQDETYESNVYKEAEEEIGLKGVLFTVGPKQRYRHPRQSFCQWYIGTSDNETDEFVLQAEEVDEVRWVELADLIEDVRKHPEKYVPSMPKFLATL